jgi:hypothetical protein
VFCLRQTDHLVRQEIADAVGRFKRITGSASMVSIEGMATIAGAEKKPFPRLLFLPFYSVCSHLEGTDTTITQADACSEMLTDCGRRYIHGCQMLWMMPHGFLNGHSDDINTDCFNHNPQKL